MNAENVNERRAFCFALLTLIMLDLASSHVQVIEMFQLCLAFAGFCRFFVLGDHTDFIGFLVMHYPWTFRNMLILDYIPATLEDAAHDYDDEQERNILLWDYIPASLEEAAHDYNGGERMQAGQNQGQDLLFELWLDDMDAGGDAL